MDLENIDMLIEITEDSNIKYEFDKIYNKLRCDRILNTPLIYPGNYGYIPNTLSLDNDALDILLIKSVKLLPNTLIKVKILGVLLTEDENGQDEKIIAVPADKVYPYNKNINEITDINQDILNKIKYFFTHYKDNDKDKWVKVGDFKNKKEALDIILKSYERNLENI
jgi:inorganic pyrophosphatase